MYGTVKDFVSAKKLSDIKITIYKNGAKVQEVVTGPSGKYEFNLDFGSDYKMVYVGGGKVSKNILIDTRDIPEEERLGGFGMNVDMTLFDETPGLDVTILEQPIGKAKYQAGEGALSWDYEYTRQIQDELRRLMREFEHKQKEQNKLEEDFAELVKKGDAAMSASEYSMAVSNFSDALGIRPGDETVKGKLAVARTKFDEKKNAEETDAQFASLLSAGDKLFQQENYDGAKAKYEEAGALKPTDPQPKEKLALVEKKIAGLAAIALAAKKKKELDDKYTAALADADRAFSSADYDQAKVKYNEALGLKSEEQYPKDKLAAIDVKLAELAAKAEEERLLKEKEARYQSTISEADAAFHGEDYNLAKTKYNEALGVMPDQPYPKEQITAIGIKLKEIAAAAEAEKLLQEKQKKYDEFVNEGNDLYASANYEMSKSKFQDALGVLPNEQYPKDKLLEIDAKVAELAAVAAAALAAEALLTEYNGLMAQAEEQFAAKEYEASISIFRDAYAKKPDEQLPLDRIAAAENILDEIARKAEAEAAAAKAAAEKQAAYDKVIVEADGLFNNAEYNEAKEKYSSASQILPAEEYPREQIATIGFKLQEIAAAEEAERLRLLQQKKYDALVKEGDDLFASEDYKLSRSKFEDALVAMPDEQYPKDKMAEIDAKLAAIDGAAEALEAEYNALMDEAEDQVSAKDYETSISTFRKASTKKPNEQLPLDRIAEVEKILEELARKADAELSASMAAAEKRTAYDQIIAEADGLFGQEDHAAARVKYLDASQVLPDEQYPKDKVAEIDRILADLADSDEAARVEAERLAAIAAASAAAALASDEAKAAEREKYDAAIAAADNAFDAESYPNSKTKYQEALAIYPDQPYPQRKLNEIDEILRSRASDRANEDQLAAELAAAEAARLAEEARVAEDARMKELQDQRALGQQKALDDRYNSIILDADLSFGAKDLSEARSLYTQALDIKPNEAHPKNRIEQIDKLLAQESIKSQEAARLAEELRQKEEEERQRKARNTHIDRGKEVEAEQFMREARIREEAEKYERIKKQRASLEETELTHKESAEMRRGDATRTFEKYEDNSAEFYVGSEKQRMQNAEDIAAFKIKLSNEQIEDQNVATIVRTNNYNSIDKEREEIQKTDQGMAEAYLERVQDVERYKEQQSVNAEERSREEKGKLQNNKAAIDQLEDDISLATKEKQQLAQDQQQRVADDKLRYQAELGSKEQRSKDHRNETMEELGRIELNQPKDYNDYSRSTLAQDFPEGVTEESYTEGNKVIIRRVVVRGNKADDYNKVIAKWGTFYFRNGQSISEHMWINDTTSSDS